MKFTPLFHPLLTSIPSQLCYPSLRCPPSNHPRRRSLVVSFHTIFHSIMDNCDIPANNGSTRVRRLAEEQREFLRVLYAPDLGPYPRQFLPSLGRLLGSSSRPHLNPSPSSSIKPNFSGQSDCQPSPSPCQPPGPYPATQEHPDCGDLPDPHDYWTSG